MRAASPTILTGCVLGLSREVPTRGGGEFYPPAPHNVDFGLFHPVLYGAAQKLEIGFVVFWTAGTMAPYGRNRPQLGVDEMGNIGSIVSYGEVKIGSPWQEQH